MNGIMPFTQLMRNIQREETEREIIMNWYKERTKTFFSNIPKTLSQQNN